MVLKLNKSFAFTFSVIAVNHAVTLP